MSAAVVRTNASIRSAAGSLMVVGLAGTELTGLEQAWLRLVRPAGIILFRRNIAEARQTRALLADATSYSGDAALRCVDIEGGSVDRLRDAVAPVPSAQAVARAMAMANGRSALARQQGELIAREALAFGFNTTLAPVLDLEAPSAAKVMGTRTAAATAEGVVAYAREFLAGLRSQGVVGCGKHYPGLGSGVVDSHFGTPRIDRSWADLWREDLAPYRELMRKLPMVMVSHAAYPETRGGERPATASSYWVTAVLRKRIGYRGLIFSDDLEMGGILKFLPIEEAAIAAIRAGIDLVEICHSAELILRCFEALIHEAERSVVFRRMLLERARTAGQLRRTRYSRPLRRALSAAQLVALRDNILRFAEDVAAMNSNQEREGAA